MLKEFLFLGLLSSGLIYAQDHYECHSTIYDQLGNSYCVGETNNSLADENLGPVESYEAAEDMFFIKKDQRGKTVWKTQLGKKAGVKLGVDTAGAEICYSAVLDKKGNLYCAGTEYGKGLNSNLLFTKIDKNGNFVWSKSLDEAEVNKRGGTLGGFQHCNEIVLDSNEDLICAARAGSILTNEAVQNTESTLANFIIKLTKDGVITSIIQGADLSKLTIFGDKASLVGSEYLELVDHIAVTKSGDMYVVGNTSQREWKEEQYSSYGYAHWDESNIVISKINSAGKFEWMRVIGENIGRVNKTNFCKKLSAKEVGDKVELKCDAYGIDDLDLVVDKNGNTSSPLPSYPTGNIDICSRGRVGEVIAANLGTDCSSVSRAALYAVTSLDLERSNITSLPAGSFKGLEQLKDLDVDNNPYTEIEAGAFEGLRKLEKLEFWNHKLERLTADMFKGLPSLKELLITNASDIKSVSKNALRGLKNLKSFDLGSYNGTTYLMPEGLFQGLTNLEEIEWSSNVTSLNKNHFKGLKKIKKIRMDGNSISNIAEDTFTGLKSLESIHLGGNKLSKVPANLFKGLKNLKTINLTRNGIESLPEGLFSGLVSLQVLELSSNEISGLTEDTFKGLVSLRELYLSINKIMGISSRIFQDLFSLEKLELQHNTIKSLSANVFKSLEELKELNLERVGIANIYADSFAGLKKLEKLDMSSNQIKSLPAGLFSDLTSLKDLDFSSNSINSIPKDSFEDLVSLKEITMSFNPLSSLPDGAFSTMSSVEKIYIYGTYIREVSISQTGLQNPKVYIGSSGATLVP